MSYIDGYVVAVPTRNKQGYIRIAKETAQVFRDHGALRVVESWADDVPQGKLTSFPLAVQCKPDESVVFCWIEWPDRSTRDEGMKLSMADARMPQDPDSMPFDGQRMIFGGFDSIVDC